MTMPWQIRTAAVLGWSIAIGFGVFCVPAIRNLLLHRELPLVFGFRAYGGGPFEKLGVYTTIPLLVAFMFACALEGVAGWLLWGGHKSGALLSFAILPVGAFFWWGFALPIPPVFALARSILLIVSWRSLTS